MKGKVNDYELIKELRTGKDLEEYADEKGISIHTIETHLSWMSEAEAIKPSDLVSEKEQDIIVAALAETLWDGKLRPAYEILGGRYPYYILKPLLRNPEFLKRIEEGMTAAGKDASYITGLRVAMAEKGRSWYGRLPGIYTYFIFSKEDENKVLFIDVTKNLGKVIQNCKNAASRIGYIEASSYEEGKVLAGYYTAGMKPVYPSCSGDANVIVSIDERKRKPGMIRFGGDND